MLLVLSASAESNTAREKVCRVVRSTGALVSGSRSQLPRCCWKGSDDERGVATYWGGGVQEPVICHSLEVITASVAVSAFSVLSQQCRELPWGHCIR